MSSEDTLPPPPPPPPVVPPDVIPERAPAPKESKPKRVPMARPGLARKGNSIQLLTNHYRVAVGNVDGHFFHYNVRFKTLKTHTCRGILEFLVFLFKIQMYIMVCVWCCV